MSSIAKASIQIGGETSELDKAINHATERLTELAVKVAEIFAVAEAVHWGYELLKQTEAAEIGLTHLLGSADAAKETLKELHEAAANSPFNTEQYVQAYRQLLNMKFAAQDIPAILRTLGDAAVVMPVEANEALNTLVSNLGHLKAKVTASAQDIEKLSREGVDGMELLRKGLNLGSTGEVFVKLEAGAISANEAVRGLLLGMEQSFDGLGSKASKSLANTFGTVKDRLGKVFEEVVAGATGGDFKAWVSDIGDGLLSLEEIGHKVGHGIAVGFQVVKNVFDGVHAIGSAIYDVLDALFGDVGVGGVEHFAEALGNLRTDFDAVKNVAFKFIEGASVGFAMVGDAVSMYLVDPIEVAAGYILKALAKIVDGLAWVLEKMGAISDTAAEWAKNVGDVANQMRALGDASVEHGKRDFNSGFVMTGKVNDFFAGMDAKHAKAASPDHRFEHFEQMFVDELDKSAKALGDFGKRIADTSAGLPRFGDEMLALTADAANERNKRANEVLKNAKSPADVFRDDMADLQRMFQEGLIGKDALADAAGKKFRGLASAYADGGANTAIVVGSAEAQRAVAANRSGIGNDTVPDILKSVEREARDTKRVNEDILRALERSKVITVGIK